VLREAQVIAPKNAIIPFALGAAFASAGSLDSAEIYFQKSLDLGGNTYDLHYFMGTIKSRLDKNDEALRHFQSAVSLNPRGVPALQSLGLQYFTRDEFPKAIEQFSRAVAVDSSYYPAWIGLGASLSLNGMVPRADTVLRRLYAVDSTLAFQMLDVIGKEHARIKERQKQDSIDARP